ncbi:hypothetical protein BKA83DRAFT_4130259 [Pisolithus microcarpus]|nr:hypothetical protein BKA83DRAFT_4130259 [Pisolithus microcarpus]
MSSVCKRASTVAGLRRVDAYSSLPLHWNADSGFLAPPPEDDPDEYHTKASLEYTEVTFDFGTQKKLNRWRRRPRNSVQNSVHLTFKRKIIFVTVHSEDEKGGDVAMRVEEFMSCLFSPPLEEVMYASTLFMLTCGPLVSFQESFTSMQQSIRQLNFLEGTILVEACLSRYHPSHHRDARKCAVIRPWGRSKLDPQPDQPKARVTKCQSKGCNFEVRTQPLPHEYQVLRGDETSGWLKYVICAAEPL